MICLFQTPLSPGPRRAMNSGEYRTVWEGGRRIRRSLGRRVPKFLILDKRTRLWKTQTSWDLLHRKKKKRHCVCSGSVRSRDDEEAEAADYTQHEKLMIMITNASRKEKMVIRSEKQKLWVRGWVPVQMVGWLAIFSQHLKLGPVTREDDNAAVLV